MHHTSQAAGQASAARMDRQTNFMLGAAESTVMERCATTMLQVNRLDKDNDALRAENNRLATLLAEREPLVDSLRDAVDHLLWRRNIIELLWHRSGC